MRYTGRKCFAACVNTALASYNRRVYRKPLADMYPTLEQLQAELVTVNAAYQAALSGAEYEIEDSTVGTARRKLKRQSLSSLLARKSELELSIGRLTGCGRGVHHGFGQF